MKHTMKRALLSLPATLMLLAMLVFASCDQMPSNPGNGGGSGGNDTTGTGNDTTGTGGDNGGNDSNSPVVDTNGNVVSVSYTFDSGDLQGWVLDDPDAEITSDRAYKYGYSIGVVGNNESLVKAHVIPSQLEGGAKIDSLSFAYFELNSNGGAGVRLLDTDGNMVVGAATGHVSFNAIGSTRKSGDRPGANNATHVQHWVTVLITLDWSAGTAEVTFEDHGNPKFGLSDTPNKTKVFNVGLNKLTNVEQIQVAHYGTHYRGFVSTSADPNGVATGIYVGDVKFWYNN